jgi:hypothetical protein
MLRSGCLLLVVHLDKQVIHELQHFFRHNGNYLQGQDRS